MDPGAKASEPQGGWRQHMPFDAEQRRAKAQKIIFLLESERPLSGAAVLEIGTGTGVIPAELRRVVGLLDALSASTLWTRALLLRATNSNSPRDRRFRSMTLASTR